MLLEVQNNDSYSHLVQVGVGATSDVYEAVYNANKNKKIIIKKIKNQEIFDHEVEMLSLCRHESIVKTIGYNKENQEILFEKGEDLFQYISTVCTFDELRAKIMFKPVFEAVQFLHSKSIIHYDIKLENLIITKKDELKLIDFGLASVFKEDDAENKQKGGKLIGTRYYFAPEVISSQKIGFGVDVWELGVTLFAAVNGYFPFNTCELDDYFFSACSEEPYWEDATVSNEFMDLIDKMLTKNPENRLSIEECLNHPWFTEPN